MGSARSDRQFRQNRELLEAINVAYEDGPDAAEEMLSRYRRDYHRRLVEEQKGGQYFRFSDKLCGGKSRICGMIE